jgi:hypothetical protein
MADDGYEAPGLALDAALKTAGVPAERFRKLKPGEVWEL